jgi:hypothetical protein
MRLHRFEFSAAVLLMVIFGIAGVVVPGRLESVGVPDECFLREGSSACRSLLDTFYAIRRDEASWLMGVGAGLFPVLIGLILGAPLVAREIEARTATLIWSLTGRRAMWMLQRLAAPLLVLVIGSGVLAILASQLLHASRPVTFTPELDQLGAQGPTFVARALMAFGLALLIGAVTGRTLSAFLVAGGLAFILATAGTQAMYALTAQAASSWRGSDAGWLIELRERYRWPDGRLVTRQELDGIEEGQLNPDDWIAMNLTREVYGLARSDFGLLEGLETGVAGASGLVAIGLTFVVIARRRAE